MTKYLRQIIAARKLIAKKGTTIVWCKPGEPVDTADTTPWFEQLGEGAKYPDIPCVFIPETALNEQTNTYVPVFDSAGELNVGIIPGDVPFAPELNDPVLINETDVRHVDGINKVAPDGEAIIYQVRFR